jgi:hypothetical protein
MREARAVVNDTPKIHLKDPSENNNAICFESAELRIPLHLSGIFSYFPCRAPTLVDLTNTEDDRTLLATPDGRWDSHSDHYAQNKEFMLDFSGNMIPPNHR